MVGINALDGVKSYAEIIGTHSEETSPSVMVSITDKEKYLFNLGEGVVRSCLEHKVRAVNITQIFFTDLSSDSIAEFSTYLLRSHTLGNRGTSLYGPENLANCVLSNRFFSRKHRLTIKEFSENNQKPIQREGGTIIIPIVISVDHAPIAATCKHLFPADNAAQKEIDHPFLMATRFLDDNFTDYIEWLKYRVGLVSNQSQAEHEMLQRYLQKYPHPLQTNNPAFSKDNPWFKENEIADNQIELACRHFLISLHSDRVKSESDVQKQKRFQQRSDALCENFTFGAQDSLKYSLPAPVCDRFSVICYIIKTPEIKGKLDAKKAAQMGVPKGPSFGKLQQGQSVTLADGRIVHSEEVMSPSRPGPVMSIVACPTSALLDALVSHSGWSVFQNGGAEKMTMMYHFSPLSVVSTSAYQRFMHSFGDDCEHVFLGKGMCRQHPINRGSLSFTHLFGAAAPSNFPLPNIDDFFPELSADVLPKKSVQGDHFMRYVLSPLEKVGVSRVSCLPKIEIESLVDDNNNNNNNNNTDDDLEIVFLGTGCSASSKLRNETGILLNFGEDGSLMLDAGNGTYGQLFRKYGPSKIDEVLRNIKAVWLSHMHADHMQGLSRLLHKRHLACAKRGVSDHIFLVGPRTLWNIVSEYLETCICLDDDCAHKGAVHREFSFDFVEHFDFRSAESNLNVIFANIYNLKKAVSVPVRHAFMSHGLLLDHKKGWSLVFSGDTAFCQTLIDSHPKPTVLIHEASFEDSLIAKAIKKTHSTIGQAVETGQKMEAVCTILTHFSQRYPKSLSLDIDKKDNVVAAFDFMQVNLRDVPNLRSRMVQIENINLNNDSDEEDVDVDID